MIPYESRESSLVLPLLPPLSIGKQQKQPKPMAAMTPRPIINPAKTLLTLPEPPVSSGSSDSPLPSGGPLDLLALDVAGDCGGSVPLTADTESLLAAIKDACETNAVLVVENKAPISVGEECRLGASCAETLPMSKQTTRRRQTATIRSELPFLCQRPIKPPSTRAIRPNKESCSLWIAVGASRPHGRSPLLVPRPRVCGRPAERWSSVMEAERRVAGRLVRVRRSCPARSWTQCWLVAHKVKVSQEFYRNSTAGARRRRGPCARRQRAGNPEVR